MKPVKVRLGNRFGFIESGIETIYDAEKAKQHKREIDDAVAKFKEETAKHDKRLRNAGICAGVVWTVALVVTKLAGWVIALGFASVLLIGFYVGVTQWARNASKPSDKYTPDIEYYLATEGKRMLSVTVEPTFSDCLRTVQVVTENADHSTNQAELNFKVVEKTDLHHIILNVNEGVVYVPYEREKGRRC